VITESNASERRSRFEALFDEGYEGLLAYARRRVGAEADDVVAETFTVAWRRLDNVPADALPWLYGVARRVISDQRRAGRRRHALAQRIRDTEIRYRDWTTSPPRPVLAALARLNNRDREAVLLTAWEGLHAEQAATAMGCSVVAFRVRLHRARKRLRAHLNELDSGSSMRAPEAAVAKEVEST